MQGNYKGHLYKYLFAFYICLQLTNNLLREAIQINCCKYKYVLNKSFLNEVENYARSLRDWENFFIIK